MESVRSWLMEITGKNKNNLKRDSPMTSDASESTSTEPFIRL